jgi:hypothetical protein
MEVFSGLMGQMAKHNDFRFHWRCEKEITHLCVADDLMIFCMFLCGVKPNTKLQLLDALGYRGGKLMVRYLGVLLITTKLSFHDFLILMDRIMAKALLDEPHYLICR